MAEARGKAWPLADEILTNSVSFSFILDSCVTIAYVTDTVVSQILDLVQQAGQYKQLKKGANEGEQRPLLLPLHYHFPPP
jgi:U4/U6 small nuclear ribonucleoprotein SNU13